ncbi:hypothetical protein FUA26_07040 [Seonamhaeicola algicola]|uniref:Uncharacterized protein n=1 Tax=Seonamhaeicola algicola TaxID=1719036 RepID=A0A5C7AVV1_9FLAO|nr:DUF6048 family protein [Seonamhaeicola algicola]TXE11813.1 hypothetical protein FUA26_07040 [Seonamhaeicola algicola]
MKTQHILTYFTSIALIFAFSTTTFAQNDSIVNATDSLKIKQKYGLRIAGDVGKLIRSFLDEDYSGFEIAADFRLKKNMYIAGEIGFEEKNTITDYMDITTNGSYFKGGIDLNMYENWLDMDNMVYAGFRVGVSSFSHDLNSFSVYSTNQYWNPQFSSINTQEFSGLTAFWGELILGMKVELFNNLYMGLNVQLKILASETDPDNFENVYIPGYGRTYDSTGLGTSYSYTLGYRIPLYKKAKK